MDVEDSSLNIASARSSFMPLLTSSLFRSSSKSVPNDFTQGILDITSQNVNFATPAEPGAAVHGHLVRRELEQQPQHPGRWQSAVQPLTGIALRLQHHPAALARPRDRPESQPTSRSPSANGSIADVQLATADHRARGQRAERVPGSDQRHPGACGSPSRTSRSCRQRSPTRGRASKWARPLRSSSSAPRPTSRAIRSGCSWHRRRFRPSEDVLRTLVLDPDRPDYLAGAHRADRHDSSRTAADRSAGRDFDRAQGTARSGGPQTEPRDRGPPAPRQPGCDASNRERQPELRVARIGRHPASGTALKDSRRPSSGATRKASAPSLAMRSATPTRTGVSV